MQSAFDVGPIGDSALAIETRTVPAGSSTQLGDAGSDALLYVAAGSGRLTIGNETTSIGAGTAGLVLAGEDAAVAAEDDVELVVATVDSEVDLHAPMGPRDVVVSLEKADTEKATGARSFQVLFGPHNGSMRATLFAGFIPPGKAPWHYHLYDEIVWVPDGPGRLHLAEGAGDLEAGTAFRLRPRQVHIVENASLDREMTIIGVFTPAGSPSAAYLMPDVAAEYRFGG